MEVKDYVKKAAEIWNEFRNSDGVPSDQQAKAILVAGVLAEWAKDQRMNRISEERRRPVTTGGKRPSLSEVGQALSNFRDATALSQGEGGKVIVRKRGKLTDDQWRGVNAAVRNLGGRWVSDKAESRWEI